MTRRCEFSVSTLTAEKLHKLYQGTFHFSFNTQVAVTFQISPVLAAEDTVVDTLTQWFLPSESIYCDGGDTSDEFSIGRKAIRRVNGL